MKNSRFVYGPATVANLDQLLPIAALHLDAKGWTDMMFGTVGVPANAEVHYDDRAGKFILRWPVDEREFRVDVDPLSSQITRARVFRGDIKLTDVKISQRDAHGLPTSLLIEAPEQDIELEVRLKDVEVDPDLPQDVFILELPNGFAPERLP